MRRQLPTYVRRLRRRRLLLRALILLVVACILLAVLLLGRSLNNRSTATGTSQNTQQKSQARPGKSAYYNAVCSGNITITSDNKLMHGQLKEISGITASRTTDDLYFAHNDSGDIARILAIYGNGKLLSEIKLAGVDAIDWEAIASGPGPIQGKSYLYVADTGDNDLTGREVIIYRIAEPIVTNAAITIPNEDIDVLRFEYSDGENHNVEALFIDPVGNRLYVIDKSETKSARIFEAPANIQSDSRNVLTDIAAVGYEESKDSFQQVTSADISPDGTTIAVRTYQEVFVYGRRVGSDIAKTFQGTPCSAPAYDETQGEAIAFKRSGLGIISVSEGSRQAITNIDSRPN